MESSTTLDPGVVHAPDLEAVVCAGGPVLTVYLDTQRTTDNASHRSEQRWHSLRRSLARQEADPGALNAVDPLVADAHLGGDCLAVVAGAEGVRHVEHRAAAPLASAGWWAPLPRLAPLLEWRQSAVPHVVVLADRRGADLFVTDYGGPDLHLEAGGDDEPLRKSAPGGWSQRRYQQRAENTWERNAGDAARQVSRLADRVGARLLVVAGDVRALQLLRESLPRRLTDRLVEVSGGRAADGSSEELAEATARAVSEEMAREKTTLLERFREACGRADQAVEGAHATLGALSRGQVEVLLLHDDPEDERTAWFGPQPTNVGARAGDVAAMGEQHPKAGRLVDVAVRAALGSGAGVRVLPEADAPRQGLGALLRWAAS